MIHKLCVMSSFDPCNKMSGRRMGGNNISAQERICAQCQGKMARFDSAHKGIQRLQGNYISTHSLMHFIPPTQLHTIIYCSLQLHITVSIAVTTLLYKSVEWKCVYI